MINHRCDLYSKYSSLAQSVEHLTVNQGVVGSSPTGGAKQRKPPDAVVFFVFLPLSDFHRRLLRRTARARSALTASKLCGGSIETRLVCDLGLRLQPMVIFFQQVISIFHLVVVLKYTCTERTSLDADRTAFRDMQSGFSLFGSLIGNACAAFDICSLLRKNSII